eukprot:350820-Chlamydomonas_euryale.AAC.1
MSHQHPWVTPSPLGHTKRPGSHQAPWVTPGPLVTPSPLGHTKPPGSHQAPWVTPGPLGHTKTPGSHQAPWVTPGPLGYTKPAGSHQDPWEDAAGEEGLRHLFHHSRVHAVHTLFLQGMRAYVRSTLQQYDNGFTLARMQVWKCGCVQVWRYTEVQRRAGWCWRTPDASHVLRRDDTRTNA